MYAPPEHVAETSVFVAASVAPVFMRRVTVVVTVFVIQPSPAIFHGGGGVNTTCPG